jgi:imidazolonepropionase-like amidohydrolase
LSGLSFVFITFRKKVMNPFQKYWPIIMIFLLFMGCGNNERITAFKNVHLVPMTGEKIVESQTVLVKGDRILKIGPSNQIKIPRNAKVIDGQGAHLMPGLADMHVHLRNDWPLSQLDMYLANGVTTVRDLDGRDFMLHWRDEIKTGQRSGPTIYVSAPTIRGYEKNPSELVLKRNSGYDCIKLYSYLSKEDFQKVMEITKKHKLYTIGHIPFAVGLDGVIAAGMDEIAHVEELSFELIDFDRTKNLKPEEWLPYIINNAIQQNKLSSGFDVKDLNNDQRERLSSIISTLKFANIPVCTTLVVDDVIVQKLFEPDEFLARPQSTYLPQKYKQAFLQGKEKHQIQFKGIEDLAPFKYQLDKTLLVELHRAGIPLVLGTDAGTGAMGIVPGFSIHDELRILVENGFTPYEAILAGTVNASKVVAAMTGRNDFGTIEVGKRADFILVNKNPLEDIAHIRDKRGVMAGGEWYEPAYLQAIASPALIPGIPFAAIIKNVHEPDNTFRTYVELVMLDKSKGILPDDIETITVTGPEGELPIGRKDFTWMPQFNEFWGSIPDSPASGTYNFTVTGRSMRGTATDFQTVNRTLPILNSENLSPADGETLFSRTPTFSWEAIEFSDIPIFYRLVILEAHSEKRVYGTGRIRVWAMDNQDGLEVQNRSNSKWLSFAMAEKLNDFQINVAIKNVRYPDDNYATHIEVIIGDDFTGNLPNNIDSITITGPKGDLPITRGGFTYYPQFKDFYISIAGSPEAGRYAFTVTSGNLKAIAMDTLSVLRSIPIPDTRALSPAQSAIIRSKMPRFSWGSVEYEKAPVYSRLEIWNPAITERAYASKFEKNMLTHTIPVGTLKAGETYKWRVQAVDSYNWERVDNRTNSEWRTFKVAETLE